MMAASPTAKDIREKRLDLLETIPIVYMFLLLLWLLPLLLILALLDHDGQSRRVLVSSLALELLD